MYSSSVFPVFVIVIVYVTEAPAGIVRRWALSQVSATLRRAMRSSAMFRGSGGVVRTRLLGFAYVTTIPFSTRAVRAVTEYVAGGRTTENTPFGSEARRAVPGPSNVRSAETRTPPLNVVTPETTNAGTRARSRVSSRPCATTRVPRNAETDPEAIAWTLYVPGWRPTEYVPSEAAIAVPFIAPPARCEKVIDAGAPAPPAVTRPRTVELSRATVTAMLNATEVAEGSTRRLPANVSRTNRSTFAIVIVVRASTVTVKSPSGTGIRYVPPGSADVVNLPPCARSKTTVRDCGGVPPFTVTNPDAVFAGARGIGRSTGPEIVTRAAYRSVDPPCVRFA